MSNARSWILLQDHVTSNATSQILLQDHVTSNATSQILLQDHVTSNATSRILSQDHATSNATSQILLQGHVTSNATSQILLQDRVTSNATSQILHDPATGRSTGATQRSSNVFILSHERIHRRNATIQPWPLDNAMKESTAAMQRSCLGHLIMLLDHVT